MVGAGQADNTFAVHYYFNPDCLAQIMGLRDTGRDDAEQRPSVSNEVMPRHPAPTVRYLWAMCHFFKESI